MSVIKTYLLMWKRIFDYKGVSSKKEFWLPFAVNAVLALVAVGIFLYAEYNCTHSYAGYAILLYLSLSFVPFLSLTVRRLHDAGHTGKWAALLAVIGLGTIIVLWLCAGALTDFSPSGNINVCVYDGPEIESYDPANNQNGDVYGPPEWFDDDYDPDGNENAAVYGPPEWFTDEEDAEEETETEDERQSEEDENYEPGDNINEPVYGPPELFENDSEPNDDGYDPEENIPEEVYGPPEIFN